MERRIAGDKPGYYPWLVAEEDGRLLGYAASSPFRTRPAYRWIVESGIYLDPAAMGRGIGRSLLTKLLEVLKRQGYAAVIGAIALPNEPSVALHEKLGFFHTGTYRQGRVQDGRMARRRAVAKGAGSARAGRLPSHCRSPQSVRFIRCGVPSGHTTR